MPVKLAERPGVVSDIAQPQRSAVRKQDEILPVIPCVVLGALRRRSARRRRWPGKRRDAPVRRRAAGRSGVGAGEARRCRREARSAPEDQKSSEREELASAEEALHFRGGARPDLLVSELLSALL